MSTAFRGGYVRGITSVLGEDDPVDAASVSDLLVNNAGHLFDAHHSHIVNVTTMTGGSAPFTQSEPNQLYYVLVARWPFEPIEQADGGSALVVYRIGFRRSGGSGQITIGVRIGTTESRDPFIGSDVSAYQSTHATTLTTTTATRGELYVPASRFNERHPLGVASGGLAQSRGAFFEVWCIHSGSKPTVQLTSVMARQYLRAIPAVENAVLREDSSYVLREDGTSVLRE